MSNSGLLSFTSATNACNSFRSNAPKCSTYPIRYNYRLGSQASSSLVIWQRASSSAYYIACFNAILAVFKLMSLDGITRLDSATCTSKN